MDSSESTPVSPVTESVTPAAQSTPTQTSTPAAPKPTQTSSSATQNTDSSDGSDWLGSLDKAIAGLDSETKPEEKGRDETKPDANVGGEKPEDSEDLEPLPTSTKAAGAKFKELKTELKTWKQKATELEQKLAAMPQEVKVPEDYEELKSRVTEYEKEISVSRVEASPQYKQAVVEPLNGVLSAAYAMAQRYEVPESAMEAMLQEQDRSKQDALLQDVVSGFSERDRLNLYSLVDDIGVILMRRNEILQNAAQARQHLEQQEQQRTSSEHKQALDSVWKVMSEKIPLFSDKAIADEVRNKATGANLLNAKPDVRAYAAYSGAVLPHLLKQNQSLTSKVAELEKALVAIRSTVPKPGQGKSVSVERNSEMSFLDALEAQL